MTPTCMIDTNVLLYAALGADSAPQKRLIARDIVETQDYATSGQILAEFYANAIKEKKWAVPLTPQEAANWVAVISAKPCVDIDSAIVMNAINISIRYDVSYWDGAILAAAQHLGVKNVYTEDLNHGQFYGSVRVVNPFKEDFLAFQ